MLWKVGEVPPVVTSDQTFNRAEATAKCVRRSTIRAAIPLPTISCPHWALISTPSAKDDARQTNPLMLVTACNPSDLAVPKDIHPRLLIMVTHAEDQALGGSTTVW